MYFYEFIFVTIYIYASNKAVVKSLNTDAGIDSISPCSVGIIFYLRLNNTSDEDCHVEVTPDLCCLKEDQNCDILGIVGGCTCYVPKGMSKLVKLVAPILDPYQRQGHCTLFVDVKSKNHINNRETVKIDFDTSVRKDNDESKIKHCKHKDEDPLNDCEPVECDEFYNGKKSFYNKRLKRCVEVPPCIVTDDTNTEIIYNPISNKCVEKSIVKRDINALKRFTNSNRKPKEVIVDANILVPASNVVIQAQENESNYNDKHTLQYKHVITDKITHLHPLWNRFIVACFPNYKWMICLLGSIIVVQCIIICLMFCSRTKPTCITSEKSVFRQFFNYQEDSVTTPLISTSNIDTGTCDNHCLSESTTQTPRQMKYYKSCSKELKNNIKVSASDDILSKCVNRRDWKNHHGRATTDNEMVTASTKIIQDDDGVNYSDYADNDFNHTTSKHVSNVVFENETLKNQSKPDSTVKDRNVNYFELAKKQTDETICDAINTNEKCRSRNEKTSEPTMSKSKQPSVQKSAQIYFSKDSIDAILSERGYIYLAGGNLSKYTLSSSSDKGKSTELSNKASRNIAKYFHCLLNRRSRHRPQSDPGKEKDLKLLHMSKVSLYSSSNDTGTD